MRALILTNNFSGLYNFRREVMKALRENGIDVFIAAPFDEKKGYFEEIGCHLIDIPLSRRETNPFKDIVLLRKYSNLLRRYRPEVVLSYTIKPNLYGGIACQFHGVPQIANITGLGSAVENPGWLQKLTVFLYRIGLRKTRMVFFQNKANRDFCISRRMVKGANRLIPGSGVNIHYHSLQEYPEEGVIKFIFISRLLKEKGIEEYLDAAVSIKGKYPDTEFHIVGRCEEGYEMRLKRLQEDGVVVYHGQQADVRPFIGAAHCTVHPSYYPEGMSNVLLESCAAGRPIITTNRPGCGEIVDDGKNGFLIRERDSADLVRVIERFLSLPYSRKKNMGLTARDKVEREFDRQVVVDAYLNEIKAISES